MLDALLGLLAPSVEMPLGVDAGNDFTAFGSVFSVETPYGLRNGSVGGTEMEFSHSLSLSVDDSDPASRLHSMIKGRLRFIAAAGTDPARLELQPLPVHLFLLKRNAHLSPLFKKVFYSNVEPVSVQAAVTTLLTEKGVEANEIVDRVGEFMAGSRQLTVEAGDFVGRAAQDSSIGGRRRLDLMIMDRDGFYLNPAHFLFQWPVINTNLEDHPLLQVMEPVQHTMVFASKSRHLYVFKNSQNPQAPYLTKQSAAHKIQDALAEAVPGDTVIVLDTSTYAEKISMRKGVTLTSQAGTVVGRIGITSNLPTIECPDDDPAVTFHQLLKPAHISGFRIKHAATKHGSGILIDYCRQAEVAKNIIQGNLANQGGGIAITNKSMSVFIKQNVIWQNEANDVGSGSATRGQGGGIYITKSADITIEDNAIFGNKAQNFGGGIAIYDASRISITKKNDIGVTTPAFAVALGNLVTKESEDWFEYALERNPQGGGGGIGITLGWGINISGNVIQHNSASRGGGIEIYDFSRGVRITNNGIYKNEARKRFPQARFGGDGGGVATNYVSTNVVEAARHSVVTLWNNRIEENTAADDGGGVYGTGKAMYLIGGAQHIIKDNVAGLNGGGVRATFGSSVMIVDGEISGNRANVNANNHTSMGGGGGVSFSNSNVEIKGCAIESNKVENFGGGGIYFATPEYDTNPIGWKFEDILETGYLYAKGRISVENCVVTANEALLARGAGSGLYVVYDRYPIDVNVKDSTFSANVAEHTDPTKKLTVVIQSFPIKHPIVNENTPGFPPLSSVTYEHSFTND
jgi:hypothetical protein